MHQGFIYTNGSFGTESYNVRAYLLVRIREFIMREYYARMTMRYDVSKCHHHHIINIILLVLFSPTKTGTKTFVNEIIDFSSKDTKTKTKTELKTKTR